MRKARALVDLTVDRGHREFTITLQPPGHQVRERGEGDSTCLLHQSRPEFQLLRAKGATKMERGRRDWERKGYRNSFIRGNIKKSWEPDGKRAISHPPVSPKGNFLPILHVISSSQLKEVFNFV
jgi:hypothetical protein